MNRLDDELRKAFRREQPPVDFAERLLQRIAQQPAPKAPWWRRVAVLLDPPKLRWVAIGVTASLLLAIGAAQYTKVKNGVVDDNGKVAKTEPAQEASGSGPVTADKDHPPRDNAITTAKPSQRIKRAEPSSTNQRLAQARRQETRDLRAEGEAAKEKLMLALSIASSALSDAQKAVHDDGLKP